MTNNIAQVHDAIIAGLREYFAKNGFTKACLGMSGGIDSAVVLALIVQVLEPENIVAVMMPSQFSSGHSVTDSEKMIARLNVKSLTIPIEPVYTAFTKALEPVLKDTPFDTTEENLQARIRGVILMAQSNKHGHIVLNTSNKSEAAVGYGTLYGDMVGALGPIADLYKTEVYALARHINRREEVIPFNIINKAPSAELRPGQRDQDSLPPYEVLDAILRQLIEGGLTPEEVIERAEEASYQGVDNATVQPGADPATVQRVWKLLNGAAFKRRQAAPAMPLSTRPLAEFDK